MVSITFLGGTREVGRSAILLESSQTKVLLDYGVMLNDEPGFPAHVRASDVNGVIVTHAHLDHSGAAPLFYLSEKVPIYATAVTFGLTELLIQDFIKLSSYFLPYEYLELENMMENRVELKYGEKAKIGDINFRLINAGHIPGSAMVVLEANNRRILYTGDINTWDTHLVQGAMMPEEEFDAVIIESTYADEEHPERSSLEKEFVEKVNNVVDNDGVVLIPAFAVGRSQELLSILKSNGYKGDVAMDGMARKVNDIMLSNPEFLRQAKSFKSFIDSSDMVKGWRDRRHAVRRPGVIIAPSGMLEGGTALFYMEQVAMDEKDAVFLVSYQIPNSGGAKLLETKRFVIKGQEQRVKAQVARYDFSSHAGKTELREFLRNLKGSPKVYVLHGAEGNCNLLANWAAEELHLEAVAPESGETFKI
jgi:putative mRNA 3-end processing factor